MKRSIAVSIVAGLLALLPVQAAPRGILLLAHGGSPEWNARVTELARRIDATQPAEVAFGMATCRNIQDAADRLAARGAGHIVAVPLFISSWSSVVTSTEYLLGLRREAPRELAIYAKMDHGSHSAAHAEHAAPDAEAGSRPIVSRVPIMGMSAALNDHPIVADILATRARSISRTPSAEAILIVAHGPVGEDENQRWLADMSRIAARLGQLEPFASIDSLTLRDDAPAPVRDAATAELRSRVSARLAEGRRVLIVPLLMSFGGIERGLATRLEGLPYTMAPGGLMPDDRLVDWVLEMARGTERALSRPVVF